MLESTLNLLPANVINLLATSLTPLSWVCQVLRFPGTYSRQEFSCFPTHCVSYDQDFLPYWDMYSQYSWKIADGDNRHVINLTNDIDLHYIGIYLLVDYYWPILNIERAFYLGNVEHELTLHNLVIKWSLWICLAENVAKVMKYFWNKRMNKMYNWIHS